MLDDPAVDFTKTYNECRDALGKSKLDQSIKDIEERILTCTDENEKMALLQGKVDLARQRSGGGRRGGAPS